QILTHIEGTEGENVKLEVALANITAFSVDGKDLEVEFESDCSGCFSFTNPTTPEKLTPYEPINLTVYAKLLKDLHAGSYKINVIVSFRNEVADTRTMTLVVSESNAQQTMPIITREIRHMKSYEEETIGFRTDLYDYPSSVIVLRVKNHTTEAMNNVRVRETIPKSVLNNVFDTIYDEKTRTDIPKVIFNGNYIVIEEDPVIEWIIDTLVPGQEVEIGYEVLEVEASSGVFIDPLTTVEGKTEPEPEPIETEQVCGDNVCQEGENTINCCSDCGCSNSSQTCQDNVCVVVIDVPEDDVPVIPEGTDKEEDKEKPVVSTNQDSIAFTAAMALLLIVLFVIVYVKRNTIIDKWDNILFNYRYRKIKKKQEKTSKQDVQE
ncbi:MAG: hypothetical protein KAS30_04590, partial [Candidatus Diapherotrites archaeon]|nr:hypothetical protein [Candidatus Diapherotrites archaeon]